MYRIFCNFALTHLVTQAHSIFANWKLEHGIWSLFRKQRHVNVNNTGKCFQFDLFAHFRTQNANKTHNVEVSFLRNNAMKFVTKAKEMRTRINSIVLLTWIHSNYLMRINFNAPRVVPFTHTTFSLFQCDVSIEWKFFWTNFELLIEFK